VSGFVASDVVLHPTPAVAQQNCCCASDQEDSQFMAPVVQSYSAPEHNHNNSGNNRSRLRRQHDVMRQVKSLRGRTASKSPPHPTYLYVVSWMYWP